MKKIFISMLIVTSFSMAKDEAASEKDAKYGRPSEGVIALLRASGAYGNKAALWADVLRKSNDKISTIIKTYMVTTRNSPRILFGAEAVAARKAVENQTQAVDDDIVMSNCLMAGLGDSIEVYSDVHDIQMIQAEDEKGFQELTSMFSDTASGEYIRVDNCTLCECKWKAVLEQEKLRVLLHTEKSCKSIFSTEEFLTKITQK